MSNSPFKPTETVQAAGLENKGDGAVPTLPRWVQIPVGLLLALFTLLCLLGSIVGLFTRNPQAPLLVPLVSLVMIIASLWLLLCCARMIFNWRPQQGLIGPGILRLCAWCFLLLPLGSLFTGYLEAYPVRTLIQTVVYVSIFFSLRSLAASRERRTPQPPIESVPTASN
ncbi:hypothetical protein [Chitinimonas lacunae]|uniref:Uncharacterized protein n=1 Tax=Chitinimonas lacunae TaxID=1963018 RepID=A0ABV8MK69_9NEIS